MVAHSIIAKERDEALEKLEEILADLQGVDGGELAEAARRAGSTSIGSPPRPKYGDSLGSAHYDAHLMLSMAEALTQQQARICALERKLEKRPSKKS